MPWIFGVGSAHAQILESSSDGLFATEAEEALIRKGYTFFPPKKIRPRPPVTPRPPEALRNIDDALRTLGLPGIRPVAPRERAPNTQPIVTTNDIAAQEAALEALGLRVLKPQPAPLTEVNRNIPTEVPPNPTITEEATVRAQKQLLLPEQIKLDTQTISPSQSQIPTREITRQAAQDTVLNAVGELPIGQDKSVQLAANQVEVNLATNSINRTFRLGLKKSQTGSNTWGVYGAYAQPILPNVSMGLLLESTDGRIDYSISSLIINDSNTLSLRGAVSEMKSDVPFSFQTGVDTVSLVQRSRLLSLSWIPWGDQYVLSPSLSLSGWSTAAKQSGSLTPIDYTVDTGTAIETYTDSRTLSLGTTSGYFAGFNIPITESVYLDQSIGQVQTRYSDGSNSKQFASMTTLGFRSGLGTGLITFKRNPNEANTGFSYEGDGWHIGIAKTTAKVNATEHWNVNFGLTSYLGGGPSRGSPSLAAQTLSVAENVARTDLSELVTTPKEFSTTFLAKVNPNAVTLKSSITKNSHTPVASAGNAQSIAAGSVVTLDASASSDADGQTLTYAWTQTSGTTVALSDTSAASPTFTAPAMAIGDADLSLVFSVTVSDGTNSSASSVTVTVTAPTANNNAPVASAGAAQSVGASASVTLDASASSDADGQTLTYAWTQTSGTTVALSDVSAASPTFTAPAMIAGDADLSLIFSVTISDGTQSSASSVTVTITAPANLATPVASAGAAQSVGAGTTVTLDASASSDADGQTLTYAWTQTSGTTVSLSDTSAISPTFTAPAMAIGDADLNIVFFVTVSDSVLTTSSAVTITVTAPTANNSAPVASAGAAQSVGAGTTVTLDASASYDADGQTLTYAWSQGSGSDVVLNSASTASPTFTAPTMTSGDPNLSLVFFVTVSDGSLTNSSSITITVTAP